MEFKGTKGKWEVRFGQISSSVYCNGKQIFLRCNTSEEAKANTLLISKAPEMLEMLQLWCMDMEERGHAYGDCYTMTKALIKSSTGIK